MDIKVGLSSNPGKDRAKAEVNAKGEQNLKEALKEVLSMIGHCFENAQLIDKRMKEKAGTAALDNEKKKAMEGNADIRALALALGFTVEEDDDDDDDDDDYYGKKAPVIPEPEEEERVVRKVASKASVVEASAAEEEEDELDLGTLGDDGDGEADDDDFDLGDLGDDDEPVDLDFGDFDDD